LDYVRYLDKVKKEPLTLKEGFKYEMINKSVPEAIPAKYFLLRLADLLPGHVHPGVKEIHDKAEHAFYILQGNGKITIDDKDYELRPDTAVYVPPGSSHILENTGEEILRWIVIYAPYETRTYLEFPEAPLMYYESLKKKIDSGERIH
jgi:mannose-6-phosphate isomerase-like protein (cupin superfamily)